MVSMQESNAPAFVQGMTRQTSLPPVRHGSSAASHLTVACILDDFSFSSFSPEADFVPVTMEDWLVDLTMAQPDLLLVESSWRGSGGSWWNTVQRHGEELRGIIAWCNDRKIPTAFWNKEDPVHFDTFLTTASLFDAVYTTDIQSVPLYREALGHSNVSFMPFAAQPAVNNPAEKFHRVTGAAFAGAYYDKYVERNANFDELAQAITAAGTFDIYDRNYGDPTPGYVFPDKYRHLIVGGLNPDEIDIAYKGYTSNLNLNSVKHSQSMFARRVFELMASNTLVISNFSRGLRNLFGDLVISTDSADELNRRLTEIRSTPNGDERLRTAAARRVLTEHTYGDRLEMIARDAGLPIADGDAPRPLMLVDADLDAGQLDRAIRALEDQTWTDWRLALVGGQAQPHRDERIASVGRDAVAAHAEALGCTHVGVIEPDDFYGQNYLRDLLLAFRWADITAAGFSEHFEWAPGSATAHRVAAGTANSMVPDVHIRRGLVRITARDDLSSTLGSTEPLSDAIFSPAYAIGAVGYCANGANAPVEAVAPATDLDGLSEGIPFTQLQTFARTARTLSPDRDPANAIRPEHLFGAIQSTEDVSVDVTENGQVDVSSRLPAGTHAYLMQKRALPITDLATDTQQPVFLEVSLGIDLMLVVYYLDADGGRTGSQLVHRNTNAELDVPERTAKMITGLRVSGPGNAAVKYLQLEHVAPRSSAVALRTENLLISNVYPSYESLYRNAFVHTRVQAYTESGFRTEVFRLGSSHAPAYSEFDNVDVGTVNPQTVDLTLSSNPVNSLLVHVLTPELWDVILAHPEIPSITIWIHGFEIQPWWRREFNYQTDAELEQAKLVSAERGEFWRGVFRTAPSNVRFVFVSRTFAQETFDDLGTPLDDDQYAIIANPIDTDTFHYRPKSTDQRLKVLSIRPYASRVYGNDLAVETVRHLSEAPEFGKLCFSFYGDGALFEETTAPLQSYDNVAVHRTFLTHGQIAALHREFGIFLVPTRGDTQGVSRDEAMASGLVPVTNAVGAVPEFTGDDNALVVAPEDSQGLADSILSLVRDTAKFSRLSRQAAAAVQDRSVSRIIEQELRLARRSTGRS